MLYIVSTTPTFSFFTSGLGCGEEWAGYQRDEEIHKQKYFLFVRIIEQFKRSYDVVILFIHLNWILILPQQRTFITTVILY